MFQKVVHLFSSLELHFQVHIDQLDQDECYRPFFYVAVSSDLTVTYAGVLKWGNPQNIILVGGLVAINLAFSH